MSSRPDHLGGGEKRCHIDKGSVAYMKSKFDIKTMVDIGCGRGEQVRIGLDLGVDSIGVDGDIWQSNRFWGDLPIIAHDYITGPCPDIEGKSFDLVWSVEFLEHVEEQYIPNFMADFQKGKYVICTFAPPGRPGHHHVNCNTVEYWEDIFAQYGFRLDWDLSNTIRAKSTMKKYFMRDEGLVFVRD